MITCYNLLHGLSDYRDKKKKFGDFLLFCEIFFFLSYFCFVLTGYEQAFVERSSDPTEGEVLHSGQSTAAYIRCLSEWEGTAFRYRYEVLNKVSQGRF